MEGEREGEGRRERGREGGKEKESGGGREGKDWRKRSYKFVNVHAQATLYILSNYMFVCVCGWNFKEY